MSDVAKELLAVIRLERSRNRWRFLTLVFVLLLGVTLWGQSIDALARLDEQNDRIAHISIEGMILEDDFANGVLDDLLTDKAVKAVLVSVDSPGGTMVGALDVYHRLRALSEAQKPVAVVMKTAAASGGYLVSLAGDRIFANEGTLTGSIGVVLPLMDVTALADKLGIRSDEVVSGDLKMATSPLVARDAQARAYLQDTVNTLNQTFYHYVTSRRSLTENVVKTISDGRVIVGATALQYGLVDAIGSEKEAKTWLVQQAQLPKDIPVVDYDLKEPRPWVQKALEGHVPGLAGIWQKMAVASHTPAAWAVLQ